MAGDPYSVVLALTAAERASTLDRSLLAARYNRAVALERVGLLTAAREEWCRLLTVERDANWLRREQRQGQPPVTRADRAWDASMEALTAAAWHGEDRRVQAIVAENPQRWREHFEAVSLVAWARSMIRSEDAESRRCWSLASSLGRALSAVTRDKMPGDIVAAVDRGRSAPAGDRDALLRALLAYGHALSLIEKTDLASALAVLRPAERLLRSQANPIALRAAVEIAACRYKRSEYKLAGATLEELAADAKRRGYTALHGRSVWLLGLIAGIRGGPTAALAGATSALADYQAMGETTNAARMRALAAEALDLLGNSPEAWRSLVPALSQRSTFDDPATRCYIFDVASWRSLAQGETGLAALFQEEALRSARASRRPEAIVPALQRQALIAAQRGDLQHSLASLQAADLAAAQVADPLVRRTLEGDIDLTRGELDRTISPQRSKAALDAAIDVLRDTTYHYRLAHALYLRSSVEAALGNTGAVERDLAGAIEETEMQREAVWPIEQRIPYLNQTRALFEAMISLQLRQHQLAAAWRYSEEIKARALLDWSLAQPLGTSGSTLADLHPVQLEISTVLREIPRDTVLVEYACLADRLTIFVLRRSRLQAETVEIATSALVRLAQQLHSALRDGRLGEATDSATALYDLLVRPISASLQHAERAVFIPDGTLQALSFAALRDRRTGRFLVQDHIISTAPSAAIFVASLRHERRLRGSAAVRALVVADPEFDRRLYPALGRLPGAAAEEQIAREFPGSLCLRGAAATKAAFLAYAPAFEVLHFGGHSVVNLEFPLLSQLVFAGDPRDPAGGVLYSGELLAARFPRTRLVVLAACGTGAGRISSTEGAESLARPFLAAGASSVVASLWDIDDRMTAPFMRTFYAHLHASFDVPAALRDAQLAAMAGGADSGAPARVWAAFAAIGASPSR
ncbi:MAG TPA: CHAT domain-containing protein [Thermoanaerobaculia bacterium]|nr:CHAT domain-containing protein [Thermoanaerobaculia bacterium]